MTIECSQSAHSIVTIKLRLRFIKTSTLPNFLFACHTILAVELIDTSASLCCFLLASVERMALRANFNVKFGLGRAGYECVATVTGYSCLVVVRMDFTSSYIDWLSVLVLIREAFRPLPVIFYGQLIHNTIGVCAMQDFLWILKNFHCSSLVPFANGASEQ